MSTCRSRKKHASSSRPDSELLPTSQRSRLEASHHLFSGKIFFAISFSHPYTLSLEFHIEIEEDKLARQGNCIDSRSRGGIVEQASSWLGMLIDPLGEERFKWQLRIPRKGRSIPAVAYHLNASFAAPTITKSIPTFFGSLIGGRIASF